MNWLEALVLGIIEGATEYLPVSSTGHLLVAQRLLGIEQNSAADAFAICIQGGAILAVLGLYFRRVKLICAGIFKADKEGLELIWQLVLAFLPAAVIGLLFKNWIHAHLFSVKTIAWAWFLGGLLILLLERSKKNRKKAVSGSREETQTRDVIAMSWKQALGIGFIQCIAMCPGVSRSLATILGGRLVGLGLGAAIEFSFLLGVVTLGAATAYDGYKHGAEMLQSYGWMPLLVGLLSAWLSAVIAVKWMVMFLNKHSMNIFGWYRIACAAILLLLIIGGYGFSAN